MGAYEVIDFHQFGSETEEDRILLFAAPARELAQWAGIPRKGWRVRMLFQRWVTEQRQAQVTDFWNAAAEPNRKLGQSYILGPTGITVAINDQPVIEDGKIDLSYEPVIDFKEDPTNNLRLLAGLVYPKIADRLSPSQRTIVDDFSESPLEELPEVSHDYVLEFALQLAQMQEDARWFVDENAIDDAELRELVTSLETLCRPAVVVDGQHRLVGAANARTEVLLPVVGMPHCSWMEQIYQFVVINEKAQKVESSLLTDIFGSSLTRDEQRELRDRLSRANVEIEPRIAAVIANRDEDSPSTEWSC